MVTFGPLAAETGSVVWGTQANFNCFRVLASLLHGIRAVGASQTLTRWTEGASYIRQGGHHVGMVPAHILVTFTWLMMECNERKLSKMTTESESEVNESENPSDFGFVKKLSESDNIRIQIWTPPHP